MYQVKQSKQYYASVSAADSCIAGFPTNVRSLSGSILSMYQFSNAIKSLLKYALDHSALTAIYVSSHESFLTCFVAVVPPSAIVSSGALYHKNEAIFPIYCSYPTSNMALYVSINIFCQWPPGPSKSVRYFTAVVSHALRRVKQAIAPCSEADHCSTPSDGSKKINCYSKCL